MDTMDGPHGLHLVVAALDELSVHRAYELLALRTEVFVVEQECPYQELDGRDLEPGARQWLLVESSSDTVVAALRCLVDDGGGSHAGPLRRVGRVVTRADHRGQGLARWLVDRVVEGLDVPVVLDAQEHLEDWYGSAGFRATGARWVEDGIPHVAMRHEPPR